MSEPAFHTFTLTDDDGKAHTYLVTPHPGSDGWAITTEMLALVSGPLAGVLITMMGTGGKLGDALGTSIDVEALGNSLRGAIVSAPRLTDRILQHTVRDDKRLSDRSHFDAAYQRNYWELAQAVWAVVLANRFLPQSAISALEKRKPAAPVPLDR